MGDSGRRRGSVRDVVDEDLPPYTDRGRYREYSALPHNNLPRPRHHSRRSTYEEKDDTILQDNVNMGETRERLHNSGYDRSMSPDLDGLEQHWRSTQDKQRSQSHRYGERRRSRSRSRGLEKSRSRSPSRSRGRIPVSDRSRSRSKGSIRGHSRSRSPFYDQGSESRQWSDRKSGRGRSPQPSDSDIGARWKGKQEPGHGSKYHYDKAAEKFSDAYYGENEPLRRPRGGVTCRDFVKGNCRYGESCRFSHSTENDNVERSFRDVRGDPDHGYNSNKAGRNLCKFFLAGNCRRDNCRFSHETPLSSEVEDRIHAKSGRKTVATLEGWHGSLWDDPEKSVEISKWGESVDADMDLSEDVSAGRRGDQRWGCSLEDETKAWEHDNKGLNRDNYHSNNRNDENSRPMVAAMATVNENSPGEPQQNLTCNEFSSHSVDKISPHIPNHNLGGEADQHYLSPPSANPQVSMTSDTYQYQGMPEHNRGPVLESGVLYELKDCRNTNGQSVSPEIRSAFCDNSSLLKMEDQQMLSPMSNVLKDDLNESGHAVSPSNVNEQVNWQQSTIRHMPDPSAHSSFSVQAPIEQFAHLNTSPMPVSNVQNIAAVHVAKSFLEEFKTQLHTVLEPSTLMTIAPSQNLLHPVPTDCPQNVSNSTRSLDQHPLLNNDLVYAANDQKARELLSSLSMINPQLSNLHQSGDPKVEDNDNSKKNLHEATQKLEVNDNGEKIEADNTSSKIEADNNCSNRADDQGKDDDGGGNNKDEKVIRFFKNALVELVKDILKPKWKEGKMSREVHKTVVKKVVDKVTVTIQAEHVPKTQEKVEQYLSSNRPKISKLVQAYVERSLKDNS